jgi:hypothetical protein
LSAAEGQNKILSVWDMVEHADVARFLRLLSDVFAAGTADGLPKVIDDIAAALTISRTR